MGENDNETECNIAANDWDFDAEEFDQVSASGKNFIEKLLVTNQRARMNSEECLEHPWIAESRKFCFFSS